MKNILIYINKNYWNVIYILYLTNKIIEFPIIIITHIILLYIYIKNIKSNNKFKIILLFNLILLISLIIKEIIKKIIFIKRPYIYIIHKIKNNKIKKKYYKIPLWLKKNWKNKKNSSFPSGHTIFSIFWIKLYKKKNIWYIYIIKNIFKIIIVSRILLYLHTIEDIIFSIILNIIIKKTIYYILKI